jgi:two-component system phosphate regulon response regulator OmpR
LLTIFCVLSADKPGFTTYDAGMNTERHRILVLDDDARLRSLLDRYLSEQGFAVKTVADAAQMDRALAREHFDLLVLDLMLPGEDGLSICRRLRGIGKTLPIVMLTARSDEIDRIIGLELGADDYLPKPFNPRELLARIHAVLRRQPRQLPGAPEEIGALVHFGQVEVDLGSRQLSRNGEALALTTGEFALLKVLLQHPREPLSRDKLMELARGREYDAFDRSIDVQISRLRKLIEEVPTKPRYLQTVWGFGYVFVPDGSNTT